MERQALEQMAREGVEAKRVTLARTVDARYVGQGYELQVAAASGEFSQRRRGRDHGAIPRGARARSYGYAIRDNAVEVVNVRVTAVAAMPRPDLVRDTRAGGGRGRGAGGEGDSGGCSFAATRWRRRCTTGAGSGRETRLVGPAIVEQLDSTTVVWPGQWAAVDGALNMVLTRG